MPKKTKVYKEPKALKMIHDIRKKLYEKTKNMSHEEYIEYIRKQAAKYDARVKQLKSKKLLKKKAS